MNDLFWVENNTDLKKSLYFYCKMLLNKTMDIRRLSDHKLIQECAKNTGGAKEEFYHRYKGAIYKKIYEYLYYSVPSHDPRSKRNKDVVESLFNEIFIKLFRIDRKSLLTLKNTNSVGGYVKTVAQNHMINYFEKLKKEFRRNIFFGRIEELCIELPKEMQHQPEVYPELDNEDRLRIVNNVLENVLTENERNITRLRYFEGKSYQEVADETGKQKNTVGKTLSNIHKKGLKYLKLKGTDKEARDLFAQLMSKTFKDNSDKIQILLTELTKKDSASYRSDRIKGIHSKDCFQEIPKSVDTKIHKRLFGNS